MTSVIRHNIT